MPPAPISTRCTHYSPSDRLPTVDTRAGPTVGCITPQSGNPIQPMVHGLYLHDATTSYLPARVHTRIRNPLDLRCHRSPFWPLTVKPSMRVPSSTWVEPTKIRLGYWSKWAPISYPPKLVTSISHLTLLVMFIYMCVSLSLTNRISHATKGTP